MVKIQELSSIAGGSANGAATLEGRLAVPYKRKYIINGAGAAMPEELPYMSCA